MTLAALSLTLGMALMTSALTVTAQEQTAPPTSLDLGDPVPVTGSLARATTREAARLAARTDDPTTPVTESVRQAPQSGPSDWSRVRQLAQRTEIIVTVKSAPPVHGYFVAADDSELMVSELDQGQVEHIARTDIAEISVMTKPSIRSSVRKGAAIGAVTGLVTGALTYMSYCKTNSCDSQAGLVLVLYPVWGWALGGGAGVLAGMGREKTRIVIYGAPRFPLAEQGQSVTVGSPATEQLFAANARPHLDITASLTNLRLNPTEAPDLYLSGTGTAVQMRTGFYWSRHLKTEIEWTSATLLGGYPSENVDTPKYFDEVFLSRWDNFDRRSLTQLYEFRPTSWWRPYVGAGVGFDEETLRDSRDDHMMPPLTAAQRLSYAQAGMKIKSVDTYPAASALPRVTTTNVRAFAKAGFKLHWGHQGMFWLTEVQVGGGVDRLSRLRIGIGADIF